MHTYVLAKLVGGHLGLREALEGDTSWHLKHKHVIKDYSVRTDKTSSAHWSAVLTPSSMRKRTQTSHKTLDYIRQVQALISSDYEASLTDNQCCLHYIRNLK